jgi:hypothetical protein
MSLIGESNQVIELQEMFNCFSHAPAQRDLIRFFGKALLANESAGHRAVNDAVNNNPNGAVEVAARCAEVFGKHVVAFKSFHPGELRQNGQDLSQLFANYGRGSVAVVLERNIFESYTSLLKVESGCSSFQNRDSTRCRVAVKLSGLYRGTSWGISDTGISRGIVADMATQCAHRRDAGVAPFDPLPGVPTALFFYEELENLPLPLMAARIQGRLRAAGARLSPYRLHGHTESAYHQQDKNHTYPGAVTRTLAAVTWHRHFCSRPSRVSVQPRVLDREHRRGPRLVAR